jgi:IS1 family transposase
VRPIARFLEYVPVFDHEPEIDLGTGVSRRDFYKESIVSALRSHGHGATVNGNEIYIVGVPEGGFSDPRVQCRSFSAVSNRHCDLTIRREGVRSGQFDAFYGHPSPLIEMCSFSRQSHAIPSSVRGACSRSGSFPHLAQLPSSDAGIGCYHDKSQPRRYYIRLLKGVFLFLLFALVSLYVFWQAYFGPYLWKWLVLLPCLFTLGAYSFGLILDGMFDILDANQQALHEHGDSGCSVFHGNTVPQEYSLTRLNYRGTVMVIGRTQMANVLPMEKKVAVISALAEGAGIRQAERMTGVNRETIMHLGVRVGKGCATLLDQKMRGLSCQHLQFDEIWGFIGKKERHMRPEDDPTLGDVWTFCAIDSDTKLVPSFKVGKRDNATANAFVADVKSRLINRVQISSDALRAYVDAIELSFGSDVGFAQIIKTYTHDDSIIAERKFSAPEVVTTEKRRIIGRPNMRLASTSHIERLNGTTRLHMRRLTRLTYAFSKKLENFEAATALHFAYYNFVKRHNTLRVAPAMEAGIERDFWTVENLVEAAA